MKSSSRGDEHIRGDRSNVDASLGKHACWRESAGFGPHSHRFRTPRTSASPCCSRESKADSPVESSALFRSFAHSGYDGRAGALCAGKRWRARQIQCSITLPGESGGGAPRARGNDFAAGIDSGKPYPGRSLQLKCTFASRAIIYTTLIVRSGFLGSSAKRTAGWFLGPVVFAGPQIDRLRFG